MKRRVFLKRAGATVAALAVGTTGIDTAAAAPYDAQESYVDLIYDEDLLDAYQPLFVTRTLNVQPTDAYAWYATSDEQETDMACYWLWYVTQDDPTGIASHNGDREFVFVEIDQTGNPIAVHYDAYHYIARSQSWETLDSTGDRAHLHINYPYHFYVPTCEAGRTVRLDNMHDAYSEWLEGGWKADAKTVTNPWRVKDRGHMWDNSATGSFNRRFYTTLLGLSERTGLSFGTQGAASSVLAEGADRC